MIIKTERKAEMENTVLKLTGVEKTYQMGEKGVQALQGIDMEIEKGSFTAIVGTSGSGKSTLLNLIGALDVPTKGEILFEGRDIGKLKEKELVTLRRDKIGFVFQKFFLIEELTLLENILVPSLLKGGRTDMEKVNNICDRLGISDRLTHLPSELSGGQQQRAAIARALVNDPPLLLCDEPTGNLDSKTSAEVADILSEINHSMEKTIIMVTHNMNMAAKADVIYTISDGKIVDR